MRKAMRSVIDVINMEGPALDIALDTLLDGERFGSTLL